MERTFRREIAALDDIFRSVDEFLAAQAIGGGYKDHEAGSLGDMGCFSFFPSKNLGAFGDGGIVTVDSAEKAERLRVLRMHGSAPKYAGQYKVNPMAMLLSVKMMLRC